MSFFHRTSGEDRTLAAILTELNRQGKDIKTIMAKLADVNSAQTTLHQDLVAENGLIKQLLQAFADQTLTPDQAQALVDGMNADDADAKSNAAAIQAAIGTPSS